MMRSMRTIVSDSSVPALASESGPNSPMSQKTEHETVWPADAPTWDCAPKRERSIPEFVPKVRVSRPPVLNRGRSRQRIVRSDALRMARSMSPSSLRRTAKPFVPGTPSSPSLSDSERSSGSIVAKLRLNVPEFRPRGISVDAAEFVPRANSVPQSPRVAHSPRLSPPLAPIAVAEAVAKVALVAPRAAQGGEGRASGPVEVNPLELDFGAMNGDYACGRMTGVIDGFTMTMTAPSGKQFIYHLCVGKVDGKPMIEARVGGKRGKATYCINTVRIEGGEVQPSKLFWTDLRPHKNRQPYVWEAIVQEAEPEGEADHQEAEDEVHVGLWVPEYHAPKPHMGLWVPEIHNPVVPVQGEGEAHHEIHEPLEGSPEGSEEGAEGDECEGQLEGVMGVLA